MNNLKNIYARLLKLFPVKTVQGYFNVRGNQNELVAAIMESNTIANVNIFCKDHLSMTKQHIYVYSHSNNNFSRVNQSVFSAATVVGVDTNPTSKNFTLLFDIDYTLTLTNPVQEAIIKYKWPVKVTITANHVIVHITVLERNPAGEFASDRKVFVTEKSIDENHILQCISTSLNRLSLISSCDLNRGVKHLWATNVFDAKASRFKKAYSISSETMDENYTIKADMQNVYNEIILTPLRLTVFKFLSNQNNRYIDHITIDPTGGQINVTIYPDDTLQVENIIESILQNN